MKEAFRELRAKWVMVLSVGPPSLLFGGSHYWAPSHEFELYVLTRNERILLGVRIDFALAFLYMKSFLLDKSESDSR
jgi:hypothetical protein